MICVICKNERKEFKEKQKEWETLEKDGFMRGITDVHHFLQFGEVAVCFYCLEDLLKFIIEQYMEVNKGEN